MREFVAALHEGNAQRVLNCFSSTRPWLLLTQVGGEKILRERYTLARTRKELEPGGWLHEILLDKDADLTLNVVDDPSQAWEQAGADAFVPPDPHGDGKAVHPSPDFRRFSTWVRWRREGNRMVIGEIALSSA
jgi:hypothetical protein